MKERVYYYDIMIDVSRNRTSDVHVRIYRYMGETYDICSCILKKTLF